MGLWSAFVFFLLINIDPLSRHGMGLEPKIRWKYIMRISLLRRVESSQECTTVQKHYLSNP